MAPNTCKHQWEEAQGVKTCRLCGSQRRKLTAATMAEALNMAGGPVKQEGLCQR